VVAEVSITFFVMEISNIYRPLV